MRITSGVGFSRVAASESLSPRELVACQLSAALGTVAGAQAAKVLLAPIRTGLKDGTRVDVYYNLHRDVLSLRDRGLVEGHAPAAFLRDVELVVNQAGRERVIEEGRKNVHAFVRGTLKAQPPYAELSRLKAVAVTYNPYKFSSFVTREGHTPIYEAKFVAVIDKLIVAWIPR